MIRLRSYLTLAISLALATVLLSACGSRGVQVAKDSQYRRGAVVFSERCAGCHTLTPAGAEGSPDNPKSLGAPTAGPNLDGTKETVGSAMYAIRNGGFSGTIMPQNIVIGQNAQAVARFVAKYAGQNHDTASQPTSKPKTSTAPVPSKTAEPAKKLKVKASAKIVPGTATNSTGTTTAGK